jgi:hypothetical protein
MAQLDETFDATSVAPAEAFEVLPAGKYVAQIVESDMKPTKNGDGQYLWLELEILEGEYKGRKTWDRLNLVNPNSQAVEIAQRALSAICHATGIMAVNDSEELHWKPMLITVRVRPPKGDYSASNDVRGYEPVGGTAPAAQPTGSSQRAAPAGSTPAAGAKPPWMQKKAG